MAGAAVEGGQAGVVDAAAFARVLRRWLPGLTAYQAEALLGALGVGAGAGGDVDGADFADALEALALREGYAAAYYEE